MRKNPLTPSRIASFLGYVLDWGAQKTYLPPEKIEHLTREEAGLQNNVPESLRQVIRFDDVAIPAVNGARFHQRSLQLFLLQYCDHFRESLDRMVFLPNTVKRSLWW